MVGIVLSHTFPGLLFHVDVIFAVQNIKKPTPMRSNSCLLLRDMREAERF